MNTREALDALRLLAQNNAAIKARLLATRQTPEPLSAFCREATALGCPMDVGDLLTLGTVETGNMLKSTNGGCPNPFDEFDEPYEMFFLSLS